METVQKRYQVPFFIWANYDIEPAYYENISANYLSTLALETAGVELPAYNQYLARLQPSLPMINALGYADAAGQYTTLAKKRRKLNCLNSTKWCSIIICLAVIIA